MLRVLIFVHDEDIATALSCAVRRLGHEAVRHCGEDPPIQTQHAVAVCDAAAAARSLRLRDPHAITLLVSETLPTASGLDDADDFLVLPLLHAELDVRLALALRRAREASERWVRLVAEKLDEAELTTSLHQLGAMAREAVQALQVAS